MKTELILFLYELVALILMSCPINENELKPKTITEQEVERIRKKKCFSFSSVSDATLYTNKENPLVDATARKMKKKKLFQLIQKVLEEIKTKTKNFQKFFHFFFLSLLPVNIFIFIFARL